MRIFVLVFSIFVLIVTIVLDRKIDKRIDDMQKRIDELYKED